MNEIEELLFEDTREKRMTSHGHSARSGRRCSAKSMRTAVDVLRGSEKRKYRMAGKVERFIMYDTIIALDKLEELPEEEKLERLTYWRSHYKNKEVAAGLEIEEWRVYELYKKYKVPSKVSRPSKVKEAVDTVKGSNKVEVYTPSIILPSGFRISIDKEFSGADLMDRLSKLSVFMEVDSKYRIKLAIEEIETV